MPHSWKWKLCSLLECHKANATKQWKFTSPQMVRNALVPPLSLYRVILNESPFGIQGTGKWLPQTSHLKQGLIGSKETLSLIVTKAPDLPTWTPMGPITNDYFFRFQNGTEPKIHSKWLIFCSLGWQTFSVKGQRINILSFASHILSVATTQLYHYCIKTTICNM